jgi:flagellin
VGASDGETIAISTISLGSSVGADFATLSADDAISAIDAAINNVSAARATFGAVQNRLDHSLNATAVYQENLVSAESRIRDVDMASEMVELTKQQILQQAGTAMLSQAKSAPQSVLSLLQ